MNHHKDKPPNFTKFLEAHPGIFDDIPDAGDCPPTAVQMWTQAQRAKDITVNRLDGWRPIELKALPDEAWIPRELLLNRCKERAEWPTTHYAVSSPVLSKKDKLEPKAVEEAPDPLQHRRLAVYVADVSKTKNSNPSRYSLPIGGSW